MMRAEEAFRFCPTCGQANQSSANNPFRCGQCGFVFYFSPTSAVGGIVAKGDLILFLVRNKEPGKGKYGLPGGFVDAGETLEQSLVREIAEETSLQVNQFRYLCSFPNDYEYKGISVRVIDAFFFCQVDNVDDTVIDTEEVAAFQWLEPSSEVLNRMAFHSNRLAIEHYLQQTKDGLC